MVPQHERYWNEASEFERLSDDLLSGIVPRERVGAPLPSTRRRLAGRLLGFGLVVASGYALTALDPQWYLTVAGKAMQVADAVAHLQRDASTAPAAPPPIIVTEAAPTALLSAGLDAATAPPKPAVVVAEEPKIAATVYTEEAAPEPVSPDQKVARAHAVAAGLSPDLPNVLLTRLSKDDLANAAYAIKTALAKTPDAATLSWPPKPSTKQALFEVHFVPGAPEGCRRYVVTVTKERWSSTSGAVEKCQTSGAG